MSAATNRIGVTVTKDTVRQVTAFLDGIGDEQVMVGVPAERALRDPEPGERSPPNNAMLAFIHENGSPAANIPARPFLRPGIEGARERIADDYGNGLRAILAGRPISANVVHHRVGLIAQAAIRQKITDGPFVPLSPVTLAKRRAKGRTGIKPLLDTAQMRTSINYVIRPVG